MYFEAVFQPLNDTDYNSEVDGFTGKPANGPTRQGAQLTNHVSILRRVTTKLLGLDNEDEDEAE